MNILLVASILMLFGQQCVAPDPCLPYEKACEVLGTRVSENNTPKRDDALKACKQKGYTGLMTIPGNLTRKEFEEFRLALDPGPKDTGKVKWYYWLGYSLQNPTAEGIDRKFENDYDKTVFKFDQNPDNPHPYFIKQPNGKSGEQKCLATEITGSGFYLMEDKSCDESRKKLYMYLPACEKPIEVKADGPIEAVASAPSFKYFGVGNHAKARKTCYENRMYMLAGLCFRGNQTFKETVKNIINENNVTSKPVWTNYRLDLDPTDPGKALKIGLSSHELCRPNDELLRSNLQQSNGNAESGHMVYSYKDNKLTTLKGTNEGMIICMSEPCGRCKG